MSSTKKILVALMAYAIGATAYAQDDVTIIQQLTVSVKAGTEPQFEQVVKAFRDASEKQGIKTYWRASQSLSGDPVYRFAFPMSSWGSLMNPEPDFVKAYGEAEAARLMGLLSASVVSTHTAFYQQRASISHPPTNLAKPPEALVIIDFMLNPGTGAQFQELTMKAKEASVAVRPNDYFVAATPSYGASGPQTILIVPSMSDLDKPTPGVGQVITQHFGEQEGARINALAAQSIASITTTLFRTRPDLTYMPED